MTAHRDLKRLIRDRQSKTGESYTAARAVVVRRSPEPSHGETPSSRSSAIPKSPVGKTQWPDLAGIRDEAVHEKTGKTWAEWVEVLDGVEAYTWTHREIARHLSETYASVNSWWAQSVTVGYERIRGMRDVGQRPDGSFDANKTRTYPVDATVLFAMFQDARRRRTWLETGVAKIRTAIPGKSIRFDWDDGTQVNVTFVPKGPNKSSVSVQHVRLAGKDDVEPRKSFWQERLDRLGDQLRVRASND